MDLQNISNSELLHRMQKLVKTERKITHLILEYILEIEARRIYAELGYDGMYTYLTRGLGYSEAAAYRRLHAARVLRQVPEVAEKIESGALNLSQLTQVQKCLKTSAEKGAKFSSAETLQVIENLENKNNFETQTVLAKAFDIPIKSLEVLKPQKDDSVRLEIILSAEQFEDLRRAKELLSHICIEGAWSDVIATMAKKLVGKYSGKDCAEIGGAKSGIKDAGDHVETEGGDKNFSTQRIIATKVRGRKAIPVKIKRDVLTKAQGCCEYQDPRSQQRCRSRYQLQIDHIQPVALGGGNEPKNLRVLCRTHNLLMATKASLYPRR